MSTITQLIDQLAQISDSLKATNTLITRLSKLPFSPGTESLDDPHSVRIELAQDIHDSLKQLEEDLELLKQEAEDLNTTSHTGGYRRRESTDDRERERTRLTAHTTKLEEDLRSSRSHFRRAQLNAKKASEAAKRKERELVLATLSNPEPVPQTNGNRTGDLFAGRRTPQPKQRGTKEEQEVDASTSVTTALRRTHDLLSTELSRSLFAQETFDQSTAALAELGEKYDSLDSVLKNSRELLGTLLRSQKSDTWYLETAFYILITTLVWLIFRRILLWPFIRLPIFLFRWILWKPIWWFLYLTGVVTTGTTAAQGTVARSSTRAPLIVQPSAAKGSIPRFEEGMAEKLRQGGGVPVGAGGSQAKEGRENVLDGEMSERIGRMAEERQKQQEGGEKKEVKRGDGTVLQERESEPPNPRKKMFEADVEDAKQRERQQDQGRDEL